MFSMCFELTPRAPILDSRIVQFMQPCGIPNPEKDNLTGVTLLCLCLHANMVGAITSYQRSLLFKRI